MLISGSHPGRGWFICDMVLFKFEGIPAYHMLNCHACFVLCWVVLFLCSVVRQLCDCTKYEASSRPLARVAWELFILHTCAWAALAWHGSAHTHMGRAAQTRAKEGIKGGSARRGQVRRVHLTLSAEPWLKTRRTECVIPLDIVASTSQNEAAVMVQGVVVFVPGTYRTTRSNSTVESELFLRYYGMPFDFYTY